AAEAQDRGEDDLRRIAHSILPDAEQGGDVAPTAFRIRALSGVRFCDPTAIVDNVVRPPAAALASRTVPCAGRLPDGCRNKEGQRLNRRDKDGVAAIHRG